MDGEIAHPLSGRWIDLDQVRAHSVQQLTAHGLSTGGALRRQALIWQVRIWH